MFDTHYAEGEFVRQHNPRQIWTLVANGDEGDSESILSGYRLCNRMGYFISTVLVPEGQEFYVDLGPTKKRRRRKR